MRLDRQITIQFATPTTSASREVTMTWGGDIQVWASVEPISGREYYSQAAEQLVAIETLRFTIRYRADVRPSTTRFSYQGRSYDVRRVAETVRNQWLEVDADSKAA